VTGQTDLYSLGVTVYDLLTGQVPFPGEDAIAVALDHLIQAPPPATQSAPSLPAAVDGVLAKALAKNPEERFASGAEFAQVADALLPADSPAVAWRRCRACLEAAPNQLLSNTGGTGGTGAALPAAEWLPPAPPVSPEDDGASCRHCLPP
jgi:serine/threonine-protein kinase